MRIPNSTVRSCIILYTRSCYVLIGTHFSGLFWSSSGSATGCLHLIDSRQWVIVVAKPDNSTPWYSKQKSFEASFVQYFLAGYPICEWQSTHFPELASVATLQIAFSSLCEGPRCCAIGLGGPDTGILSPSEILQLDGFVAEQTTKFSSLEPRHR